MKLIRNGHLSQALIVDKWEDRRNHVCKGLEVGEHVRHQLLGRVWSEWGKDSGVVDMALLSVFK